MRRFAGSMLVAAGLAGLLPVEGRARGPIEAGMAERLDALLNAGKTADAAALFADDATARTPDGRSLSGREAIAGWLGTRAGFHADSGNRQVWEGGRVTWATSLSDDRLRALAVAPLAANVEVVIANGKVAAYTVRYTAESRVKLAEATAREQEGLFRKALGSGVLGPEWLAALPDLALTTDEVVVANDRVAARGRLTGTWTGVYFGVTGTGQPVSAEFLGTARIVDGAVADTRLLIDLKAIQDQMGFTVTRPAPAPKSAPGKR